MLLASSFWGLLLQFVDVFLVLGVLKTGCGIPGVIYQVLVEGIIPSFDLLGLLLFVCIDGEV